MKITALHVIASSMGVAGRQAKDSILPRHFAMITVAETSVSTIPF
jgi:hypothetical protein